MIGEGESRTFIILNPHSTAGREPNRRVYESPLYAQEIKEIKFKIVVTHLFSMFEFLHNGHFCVSRNIVQDNGCRMTFDILQSNVRKLPGVQS